MQKRIKWRFSKALAKAKTWFSMWKSCWTLVWTWSYSEGAKRSDPGGMSSRYLGISAIAIRLFCRRTCRCRRLSSAFETDFGPLSLAKNTPLGRFSLHCWNRLAAVRRIPIFGGMAAIFARLEFAGLLYLIRFSCESPGYRSLKFGRHTSVHRCGIGLASRGIYPQNMRVIKLPPLSRH